jgi:hypothetical protein
MVDRNPRKRRDQFEPLVASVLNTNCQKLIQIHSWGVMPRRLRLSATLALAVIVMLVGAALAVDGGWEYQPYRVHALLAIDAPGGLTERLATKLPEYLVQRVDASLAPAWIFDVQLAAGAERAQLWSTLESQSAAKPTNLPLDKDKLLLLSVQWTPSGFELAAREYDAYVARWGATIRRECRQQSALPEQLFAIARQAFAPLAQFEVDANDPKKISLKPRGASLPRSADAPPWFKPGDLYKPILRRTSRGGQIVENGIAVVPWTYIEVNEGKDKKVDFATHSGSRQPFSARRQGRTEQLAIGVQADAGPTTLRLYSRKNEKKPLVGYEVLLSGEGDDTTRIGVSDTKGEVRVLPGKSPVEMLFIKHGGQLLGKLPVVPGAESLIKIPLPDDDARLLAEARLAAVREDLIDVVARRNILMARARQKIAKKDFAGAQELLRTLDDLPGKPQFSLTLTNSARALRSDDPQMQRRIDQLFQATQTLTTQFLDVRPISQLHNELREAQSKPAEKTEKPKDAASDKAA